MADDALAPPKRHLSPLVNPPQRQDLLLMRVPELDVTDLAASLRFYV